MTDEMPHDHVGTPDDGEALDTPTGDASTPTGRPGVPGLDLRALREGGRDPKTGRWMPGAMPRVRTGLRLRDDHPALAPLLAEREAKILADLGHDVSTVEAGIVKELARVMLLAEAAGEALIAGGLLTAKGSARAWVSVYQTLLDRQIKLASMVGLSRRQKPAQDLRAYIQQQRGDQP